jgi:type IV pilus assembly protein PilC
MAFIVTPGYLKDQGEFYHQLASMTAAGVSVLQAVEMLRRNAPNRKLARVASGLMDGLVRGYTFTEALRSTGRHLPEFDVALIEAGEASGRMDQCFKLLGDFYEERGRLASRIISELLYPVFLFHFALLIFPTGMLSELVWKGNTTPYISQKVAILLPTYAAVIFILWSLQSERSLVWRGNLERLFGIIPVIGSTQRSLALARLSAALEALINAGVTIIEAWDLAGRASGSQRLNRAVIEAKPRIQMGELPSEVISSQRVYPDLFTSSYKAGEVSGRLDDALRRLYRHYLEAATTGLHRLAEWLPKLVYIGVLIGVGIQIIMAWQEHFKMINDAIGQ